MAPGTSSSFTVPLVATYATRSERRESRIQELEARLADFSAALGREREASLGAHRSTPTARKGHVWVAYPELYVSDPDALPIFIGRSTSQNRAYRRG
jgi:hypothetical protein